MTTYEEFIRDILSIYQLYGLSVGHEEFGDFVIEGPSELNNQRLIEAKISSELPKELPAYRAVTEELLFSCVKCGWPLSSAETRLGLRVHENCRFVVGERS